MSKRQVVGRVPNKELGILADFFKKARKNPIWIERLGKMSKGENPFEGIKETTKNWLQPIVDLERKCHQDFFGKFFGLAEFTRTLKKYGAEKVEKWKKLGLEPHFLPTVSMMSGDDYPGWKIRPEEWFYRQFVQGNIFQMIRGELQKLTTINLDGTTVLVDTRLKPRHNETYENDWLSDIIVKLRKAGKLQDYNPRTSRFNVSAEETEIIRIEAAQILGLNPNQLRLEREIEANVIPQLYPHMPRKDDGKTDTREWREEYFGDRGARLDGGNSDDGGLADVHCYSVSSRRDYRAFRLLAVL